MADYPYMPLWVADYLADTPHLDATEHGVYLLLLMAMWRSEDGTLPNDPVYLCRIARCSTYRFPKIWEKIRNFFEIGEKKFSQKRLSKERAKIAARYSTARANVKKRWEKKVLGNAYGRNTGVLLPEPYPYTKNEKESPVTDRRGRAREAAEPKASPSDPEIEEFDRQKRYPDFKTFESFCRDYAMKIGKPDRDWEPLFDYFEGPGWRLRGEPIVKWKNTTQRAIREDWQMEKAVEGSGWVTYEMVEDYVDKKDDWGGSMIGYAWGKLMGGKYYGKPITNRRDFKAAMEAIGSEWSRENK